MKTFGLNNLSIPIDKFKLYERTIKVRACRIDGPFTVGLVYIEDGYVVLDAKRIPHAYSKAEFESLHKPIKKTKSKPNPKPGE